MSVDEARDRLMRLYAPRLVGALSLDAIVTPIETVDDQIEDLEEDLEELEELVDPSSPDDSPDNPDAEEKPDGEQLDPEDEQEKDEPDAKPMQRAYAEPRRPEGAPNAATTGTGNDILWHPVVTTLGARTFLTAPATTERAAMWDDVPNPNPHIKWMQGRFVGAERPNRNGAFWSAQDLELGHPTVTHGPLNWLHEGTHVIGTIADARFVPGPGGNLQSDLNAAGVANQLASEQAAETADPHIVALSAIWQWVYPQEASVVQMASDAGLLAYSMECISEAVQCVGAGGCGEAFPYMQYAHGQMCDHLKERASVRRLVNPTFLGGAVIVPPSRPGWADADARVMAKAADVAERAFDQAGRPDIPSSTWEQMMAGIVKYAEGSPAVLWNGPVR